MLDLDAVVRTLWVEGVEFVEFFVEHVLHVLVPFFLPSLAQQFHTLGRALAVAEFFLDVLDLLLQEVFALLLVDVLTGAAADVLFQFQQLCLLVDDLQQVEHAVVGRLAAQQLHLVGDVERKVGAHEVYHHHAIGDVGEGKLRLIGYLFVFLDIVYRCHPQVFYGGIELGVVVGGEYLGDALGDAGKIGTVFGDVRQAAFAESLHDGSEVVGRARHLEHPDNFGIDAILVEVACRGRVYSGVFLAEDGDDGVALVLETPHQVVTGRPPHEDGCYYARKQNHVARGEDGYLAAGCHLKQIADVAFVVGYHLECVVMFFLHSFFLLLLSSLVSVSGLFAWPLGHRLPLSVDMMPLASLSLQKGGGRAPSVACRAGKRLALESFRLQRYNIFQRLKERMSENHLKTTAMLGHRTNID